MKKKCDNNFIFKIIAVIITFTGLFYVIHICKPGKISIIKDISKSLPHKLYIGYFGNFEIKKGDIVLLKHPSIRGYLIKKITGMKGDRIDILDDKICINDKQIGSILKRKLNKNEMVTPINTRHIETDYYFVCGTHEESFDSRYEEFGLIRKDDIKALLWSIF